VRHAAEARALALDLHAAEPGPALVTGVLSRLNDAITERVLALMQARHRLPPARWCWLGPGLGRPAGADPGHRPGQRPDFFRQRRRRGARFARTIPALCPRRQSGAGRVRLSRCATARSWAAIRAGACRSRSGWRSFGTWVRTPEPEALLNAAIFFDFRPLAGDAALAAELRRELGDADARQRDLPAHDDRQCPGGGAAAGPPARFRHRARVRRHHRSEEVRLADLRRCGAHLGAGPRCRRDGDRGAPARRPPGMG
jgi:hypothetical protein